MNTDIDKQKKHIDVTISIDKSLFYADKNTKNEALTTLFVGLTNAIRNHGCNVDITDPLNIKIRG